MNVGFIGTGFMGSGMAWNLLRAGHAMTVFDVREEAVRDLADAGAALATGPRAVAEASEVVFTSLPGPPQVEEVMLGKGGLAEGLRPGSTYVDLSTSRPELIRRIGEELGRRDIAVLDAPVSGGAEGARAGTLSLLVGGDEAVYKRVKPLLDTLGDKAMYCGLLGSGLVCKLCNNLLVIGLVTFLPEVFTAGIKAGVPAATLLEAISRSSGNTERMRTTIPRFMARNFAEGAGKGIVFKDVSLGVEMGRDFDVPMEISEAILGRIKEAAEHGHGDHAVLWQEERAGVEIR